MDFFLVNGYIWGIKYVSPQSEFLIDRSGNHTVATTDPNAMNVYLSKELTGDFKKRVIAHELGHVFCFSYGLLDEIHSYCRPQYRLKMEEFICNIIADYAEQIFEITYKIMGDEAIGHLPYYLERMVA